MGSVFKSVKKAAKGITKGFTKAVKSTIKRVKKVGKAVMKGVAKISNKLGPVGMIALSIAMPYALAGLSSMTTAAMASQNVFLQSIGTVGNAIRTGYQAFNAGVSSTFSSITKSISESFQKFAPKTTNMFSRISEGAKNLYSTAKEKVAQYMPKPFTAQGGTVNQIDSGFLTNNAVDPGVNVLSSADAAKYIQSNQQSFLSAGKNVASEFSNQTLSSKAGFFTKANTVGVEADKIVQDTINSAYEDRLKGFSKDATRMFTDVKNKAKELGTYVNDEQIGSFVENNVATTQRTYTSAIGDTDMIGDGKTLIDTDTNLLRTGDYEALNEAGTEFQFTGKETFKSPPVKSVFEEATKKAKSKAASAAKGYVSSLLTPNQSVPIAQPTYYAGATSYDGDMTTDYGGTNIKGSKGGSLVAQVFGDTQANQIRNYYQNMNILGSIT